MVPNEHGRKILQSAYGGYENGGMNTGMTTHLVHEYSREVNSTHSNQSIVHGGQGVYTIRLDWMVSPSHEKNQTNPNLGISVGSHCLSLVLPTFLKKSKANQLLVSVLLSSIVSHRFSFCRDLPLLLHK